MAKRNSQPTGQCLAVTKWIYNTRCSRRATPGGYLCKQHERHGASIPTCWSTPEANDYGVLISRPEPPYANVAPWAGRPAVSAVTQTDD